MHWFGNNNNNNEGADGGGGGGNNSRRPNDRRRRSLNRRATTALALAVFILVFQAIVSSSRSMINFLPPNDEDEYDSSVFTADHNDNNISASSSSHHHHHPIMKGPNTTNISTRIRDDAAPPLMNQIMNETINVTMSETTKETTTMNETTNDDDNHVAARWFNISSSTEMACRFPELDVWFRDEGLNLLPTTKKDFCPDLLNVPLVPVFERKHHHHHQQQEQERHPHRVDYFYSNHHKFLQTGRYARIIATNTTTTTVTVANQTNGTSYWSPPSLSFQSQTVWRNRTDPLKFWGWKRLIAIQNISLPIEEIRFSHTIDGHGMAILDLDSDGYQDLLMSHASYYGLGMGLPFGSHLYWGQPLPSSSSQSNNANNSMDDDAVVWSLAGGALAAHAAGLSNDDGNGRGRGIRIADFNNDGQLDILFLNIPRSDSIHSPARIYYGIKKNRTFVMDPLFDMYVSNALWTGRDLLVYPLVAYCPRIIPYCNDTTRRQEEAGRWSTFYFDPQAGGMVKKTVSNITTTNNNNNNDSTTTTTTTTIIHSLLLLANMKFGKDEFYSSLEHGDIDGDGEMDIMLTGERFIYLAYSRAAAAGHHQLEKISLPRDFSSHFCFLRDFNLDSITDILCISRRRFHDMDERWYYRTDLYTQASRSPSSSSSSVNGPPYWVHVRTKEDFPKEFSREYFELSNPRRFHDGAAVDYSNDGYVDIMLTSESLLHLTNMFGYSHHCTSYRPSFVSVVLKGSPSTGGNAYGIGSRISLLAVRMLPGRDEQEDESTTRSTNSGKPKEQRWFHQFVTAYSHGNTQNGGATDHRYVFGLGMKEWHPILVNVTFQDGRVSSVSEDSIRPHMNQMTNPVVVYQNLADVP